MINLHMRCFGYLRGSKEIVTWSWSVFPIRFKSWDWVGWQLHGIVRN